MDSHASSSALAETHSRKAQPKHPLLVRILERKVPKSMEKLPRRGHYKDKMDFDEHMQLMNDQLSYFSTNDPYKSKLFTLTLLGPIWLWLNGLSDESIHFWAYFCERFSAYFTSQKRLPVTEASLSEII